MLINIPIEPLEERYSIQWRKWFVEEFYNAGINFVTVNGIKTKEKIIVGSFLDVVETNIYKATQFIDMIGWLYAYPKSVLFFHDLWNPMLTALAYIRDGMGWKDLKIVGCLHAGAYDENDFLYKKNMNTWATGIEESWFSHVVDRIYVATPYHKHLLCSKRNVPLNKVIITGFPIYPDFVPENLTKENNLIVFPHRLDVEKQPYEFDKLKDEPRLKKYNFVKTKDVCKTKKEYYELLGRANIAISFALQETWGIAMQEATICECIPLVPNRLSYEDMYDSQFRYDTKENLINKIVYCMENREFVKKSLIVQKSYFLDKGKDAISKMIYDIKTNYGYCL